MMVFDSAWVDVFRTKIDTKSGRRPFLYYVATSTDFAQWREEIERYVKLWPENIQEKFIAKLRNPRHFRETFHELAVGAFLRHIGCEPEYEKLIFGLTPDYMVSGSSEGAILEVFTCNMPSENASYYRQVNDLSDRISKIPVGVNLHVQINCEQIEIDQSKNKEITAAITTWIQSNPAEGGFLELHGIHCKILSYSSRSNAASMISTVGGDNWVNNEPLGETIREKISKYKHLNLPIVICIAATESGVMPEDIENILFGNEALQFSSDSSGEPIPEGMIRLEDGILRKLSPHFAGVIWFDRTGGQWRIRAIPNPDFDISRLDSKIRKVFQDYTSEGGDSK
jgi:hypothetical protein